MLIDRHIIHFPQLRKFALHTSIYHLTDRISHAHELSDLTFITTGKLHMIILHSHEFQHRLPISMYLTLLSELPERLSVSGCLKYMQ
jgi:hypothetical protein